MEDQYIANTPIPNGHFYHGECHLSKTDECIEVVCPSTGEVYAQMPIASKETVDNIVLASYNAQRDSDWATRAPRERAKVLYRWATLIEQNQAYLARLEAIGSSRPMHEVLAWDIPYIIDTARFFAELADKHGGYIGATQSDRLGMVIREPYGVVGAITPWNFPLSMAMWKAAPALSAGNAIVIKPSELTPFSTVYLAKLAFDAGLPKDIFNVVLGSGRETGAALCEHPQVGKVTFTGSTQTGASIMSACAMTGPKPVTLELGGKSPQIVFADTKDLERTAHCVAKAITGNAGQVCVSGSRLIIDKSIEASFIECLKRYFKQLSPGVAWESETTLSPIISRQQATRIQSIVDQSIKEGADCLCGGEIINGLGGAYFAPTLLKIHDEKNIALEQEIFGPVLTIQTFDTEHEAWSLAQHDVYGLAAGIHSANLDRVMRGIRKLEVGSVWINRYGRSFDHIMPTGGYKRSGIGKDIGIEAFEANLRSKSVLLEFDEAY